MYYPNDIEDICYEEQHIEQVITEIKAHFHDYFNSFIESGAGTSLSADQIQKLAEKFGSDGSVKTQKKNVGTVLKQIIAEGINGFEKDRQSYVNLLDEEALEEYEDSPSGFKNALRKDCPIIRVTLMSKAKELDKYKMEFSKASPENLLSVSKNLSTFATSYTESFKNADYHLFCKLSELELEKIDTEDYSVFGVIGGGIKSHFLFKLNPAFFPYRSKESIWALWFLTGKKELNCEEGSQFLMINIDKNVTNQNFFYPYELFGYYAYQIYLLLKKEAVKHEVNIPESYRYVLVNSFLNFVAHTHEADIQLLSSNSEDRYHPWA